MPDIAFITPDVTPPDPCGGPVVLFFHRLDDTSGRPPESIGFFNTLQAFTIAGKQVFGNSGDRLASRRNFTARVAMISGGEGRVCAEYGTWAPGHIDAAPGTVRGS